jgi:hypothetical protein
MVSNLSIYQMRSSMFDLAEHIPALIAGRDVRSFAPAWSGFAIAPAGTLRYADLGPAGLVWTLDAMTGESSATMLAVASLPEEIRPRGSRCSSCYVIDGGALSLGGVQVDERGVMTFQLCRAADPTAQRSRLVPDASAFTPSGRKGLPKAWALAFPK